MREWWNWQTRSLEVAVGEISWGFESLFPHQNLIIKNNFMKNKKITNAKEFLGKKIKVIFDRPLGTRHEKYKDLIYELNYGYIPNTLSGDGEELDAYYLDSEIPLKEAYGICIAYLKRESEDDDKLILIKEGVFYTDEEILKKINFCEKFFKVKIFRK